jgi:hypothetical protein
LPLRQTFTECAMRLKHRLGAHDRTQRPADEMRQVAIDALALSR